jgi:HSP20 family protein
MFNDFWAPTSTMETSFEPETGFMPAVDVEDAESHYLVSFDLPGLKKDDLCIDVEGDQLVVSGERKQESEKKEGRQLVNRERYYGAFERTFTLPATVEADKIEASYDDGVLRIAIPKGKSAQTKSIEIGEGKSGVFSKLLGHEKTEKAAEKPSKEKAA